MAFVPAELDGWHLSPEFPTFDLSTDEVDPVFMNALASSPRFWASLKGASKGIGARRERVNAARLLDQEVKLPSLWEQRTVATTLIALASSKSIRDRSNGRLNALMPAAINEAFAGLSSSPASHHQPRPRGRGIAARPSWRRLRRPPWLVDRRRWVPAHHWDGCVQQRTPDRRGEGQR